MRPERRPRRTRRGIIIGAIIGIVLVLAASSRFYTDLLWFQEVGFSSVLWTSLRTQFGVGLIVGLVTAGIVFANLAIAARLAPPYRGDRFEVVGQPDPVDRYREMLGPYLIWVRVAVAAVVGLMGGLAASSAWQTFLLWANRSSFAGEDPQFGKNIGFYVFELPFFNTALGWLWFALIAALVISVVAHYFHGSIRPEARLAGVAPGAMVHVSVLLGLLALAKAVQYWLGRYQLNFSGRGVVTGASYTDVNAQLPALTLLTIISIISAGLFLVNIRFRSLRLPLAAVGIWILTSVLAGGVWPLVIQNFSVRPQELQREEPFIERNIAATREAFGLADVESAPFAASTSLDSDDVETNAALLSNVRLWDPHVLRQALSQLQAIRTYYKFEDVDVDRYDVEGQLRQVLLSAREIVPGDLEGQSKTWANLHLQYTHGYGVTASLANEANPQGQPKFLVSDVPGTVTPGAEELLPDEARIYYGESFTPDDYAIVDSEQEEIDYATDEDVVRSRYEGSGGVEINSIFRRFAFAIREGDPNLLLSSLITSDSRMMIYRNVRDRVLRAAPFLSLDNDPYVAVVDGRVVWIVDAYTSTSWYPYAQRYEMDNLVGDEKGALDGRVNYVRNSVKVVVDAYEGTMRFYVVDPTDPLIQTWQKAFPALFTSEEPSPDLAAHFRYPEDLFSVQSDVYRLYHMTDPANFYAKEDAWALPDNPLFNSEFALEETEPATLPPAYLLIRLPGSTEDDFVLTRPFTPRNRSNMISFFTADSGPGETYGQLRVLQFPRQRVILGPTQVDNLINQDTTISPELTLLSQSGAGSRVIFGSLVTLPIEDSILYVQPLFVTAENLGIPELKRVIVVFADRAVMATTFEEALAGIFGTGAPDGGDGHPGDGNGRPSGGGELADVIAEAARVYAQAQEALQDGDFQTYGRLIERLGELLERAERLQESGRGGSGIPPVPSVSVSPSAIPSPTASP
ncbi:MAG TPA: UPF0182 family protein [Actinomycetota bacterium]|jgi:hypothetical protein